jgi:YfiH family protein
MTGSAIGQPVGQKGSGRRAPALSAARDAVAAKERGARAKAAQGIQASQEPPGVVAVDGWEMYPWLRAGFSTRQGGGSTVYLGGEDNGPTDVGGEQNLGWTAHDEPGTVAENRRRFLEAVCLMDSENAMPELVTLRQIHSGMVRVLDQDGFIPEPHATPDGKAVLRGDGMMVRASRWMLGIQTADCVPVLLADTRTRAVAAFHAGWRGTLTRIVEHGVGTMRVAYGSRPKDLIAAIGPAIRPCCFAVGEEVSFAFESQFRYDRKLFREVYDADPVKQKYPMLFLTARAPGHSNLGPQMHMDLQMANRRQLLDAGLRAKAITVVEECTAG